ncbi:hypothetical protein Hamer_G011500 [Homarus americanus]|uniref:Uncharacterized protein n=1 Tax=Homarus americanus TaxID=6706 RepID=A0A8J5JMH4_HOMAM|nr:hypothetical protein Hamer_G011500 [Homarus americanus]
MANINLANILSSKLMYSFLLFRYITTFGLHTHIINLDLYP